jgi:uncharacterized membrane protein
MDLDNSPLLDIVAVLIFVASWTAYHFLTERGWRGRVGLSRMMIRHRHAWGEQMSRRDARIVDASIMSSLQNGTAFFASTSLLALGGATALLRATDDALRVFTDLPFGIPVTRALWELKVVGLAVIFGYAFFKFAWSYRLFNYAAILLGATPAATHPDAEGRRRAAARFSAMVSEAGRHFTRGQRAFFFSFAYLGWFVGPYVLIMTTAAIVIVIAQRQFGSPARAALEVD